MIENKPLIYYCIALFIGSYSALFYLNKGYVGAVLLAASFLICIFKTQNKRYFIIVFIFAFIGFINYITYFKIQIPKYVTVRIQEIRDFDTLASYKGRNLVIKEKLSRIDPGEMATITGEYNYSPTFEKGTVGELKNIKVIAKKKDVITSIYELKKAIYNKFSSQLGEKYAGEVMAVAFGDTGYLQQQDKADYKDLGIYHVVSVSGLHMALIYKLAERLFGFSFGIILSLIFCIFTGATAPTVRAFIMIVVFKLSKKVYKNYEPLSAISLAAIIIINLKPFYVLDIGCNLSFLAVIGIVLFYNRLRKQLVMLPNKLNEGVSLCFSAQIFTMPVSLALFNGLSTAMLQGNFLLVPIYSVVVIGASITVLFIKFDYIFKMLCSVLKLVLITLEGGKALLLKFSFGMLYFSYIDCLSLCVLYISFMLIKKGRRHFIYFPLLLFILYFFSSYSLTPQIEYVKVENSKGVICRDKFDSCLFIDRNVVKDEDVLLKKKYNVVSIENVNLTRYKVIGKYSYKVLNKGTELSAVIYNDKKSVCIDFVRGNYTDYYENEAGYDIIYVVYDNKNVCLNEYKHMIIAFGKLLVF